MNDNRNIYETVEFDNWAYREGLGYEEKFLIEKYLNKDLRTLEAGTGGGRIILEMKNLGFTSLQAYDYLPGFIEQAKKKDSTGSIYFEVEDATDLSYKDCSFDQILYLQQLISSIDGADNKLKALKEAYRILKQGGTALFSFLSFESRVREPLYMPYLAYLLVFRKLLRTNRSMQYLPWLKLGGKLNFFSLLDRAPYVYWYKMQEAYTLLKQVEFEVVAFGSGYQISQGSLYSKLDSFANQPIKGGIYFVCTK